MRLFRIILLPFSWIYGAVVYLRNYFYDHGLLVSNKFETPIVCVGNLSLGGTGKTPMVELLIRNLKNRHKIAILSRGYGRKSKGFLWAKEANDVTELGDEPFQIHSKFPDTTLAVDVNRSKGIQILEKETNPDLILLDDAYQHRKVQAGYSILLTAYGKLYVDDNYLPLGTLRDHKNQVKRADVIIVTKCPLEINTADMEEIIGRLKPMTDQKLLFSTLKYARHLKGGKGNISLDGLKGKTVTLVTGIANPAPLVSFLEKEGIHLEHLSYRDHHFFSEKEIQLFNTKEILLTTEKDYVRLSGKVDNLYYIEIEHEFIGDGKKTLLESLDNFMS